MTVHFYTRLRATFPRSFWICVFIALIFNLAFITWVLVKPGSERVFTTIDDAGQAVGWLLSTLICFFATFQLVKGRFFTKTVQICIPVLFGMGCFGEFVGEVIYTYNGIYGISKFPSWADAGFLSALPLFLSGIFLIPIRPLSHAARSRIIVDCCIIMTSVITFSWYFILGPTLLQGQESLFAKVIGSTYPIFDLLMIFSILFLSLHQIPPALKPSIYLLSLSLMIIAATDSTYDFMNLHDAYTDGWQDMGWPLGYLMLSIAILALCSRTIPSPSQLSRSTSHRSSLIRTLLPFLIIPVVLIFCMFVLLTQSENVLTGGVYIGGLLLVIEVMARQLLSFREIHQLNHALHNSHQSLFEKNNELALANQRLEALATTDPLTELLNHRALVSHLEQELIRSQRHYYPCTLFFIDVDHFKALNDSYGHPAGDVVLREFAKLLHSSLRPLDIVGRWGGEEFMALLPELSAPDALALAEIFRATVAKHRFSVGGGLRITCSLGLACFPDHALQSEALIAAADQAMYAAKRLGRNQVRVAGDSLVLSLIAEEVTTQGRDEASRSGTVEGLFSLLERSDPSTAAHSQRVSQLLFRLALSSGMSQGEAQMVAVAGLLHDLGKIAIPDKILHKNSHLDEDEWEEISMHPQIGASVVSHIPALQSLAPLIESHHERWDGKGYPNNLKGTEIPFATRLLSVVDAYDVITHGRDYQHPRSMAEALEILRADAGSQFDPEAVQALSQLLTYSDNPVANSLSV